MLKNNQTVTRRGFLELLAAAGLLAAVPHRTYFLPLIERPQNYILVDGVRYPVWGDGIHDDSLNIQTAVSSLAFSRGTADMRNGVYAIASTIVLPQGHYVIRNGNFKAFDDLDYFFRQP